MDKEHLISEMLLLPAAAIDYHISQHLLQFFPDKAFIESEGHFNVEGYAKTQQCTLTRKTFTYNQMNTYWPGPEPQSFHPHQRMVQAAMMMGGMNQFPFLTATTTQHTTSETQDMPNKAWFEVQWQENTLDVLILNIQGGAFQKAHFWILAETADIARAFFATVSRWSTELHGEVLVFDNGCWHKDEQLFQDIKNATSARHPSDTTCERVSFRAQVGITLPAPDCVAQYEYQSPNSAAAGD